jgi:hypothetical protein
MDQTTTPYKNVPDGFDDDRQNDSERLSPFAAELIRKRSNEWAWRHYKDTILGLVALLGARRLKENTWPLSP